MWRTRAENDKKLICEVNEIARDKMDDVRTTMSEKMKSVYDRWQMRDELPILLKKHSTSSTVFYPLSSKPYPRKLPDSQEQPPPPYELSRHQSF